MAEKHEAVVIDPELLKHATPEEREAYQQYLMFTAIEMGEWEAWLQVMVPSAASKPFSKHHSEFWDWLWEIKPSERPKPFVAIWPRGQGKRLASSTPILTTEGWKTQGTLNKGDFVFGPDGQPTEVTWVGPETMRPLYRVTLTDGYQLDADPEHEWTVRDRGPYEWRTLETQQIAQQKFWTGNRARFQLPYRDALQMPEADLPIAPYLMGYWLGDGNSLTGVLATGTSEDSDEVVALVEQFGEVVKNHRIQQNTGCHYVLVANLRNRLDRLGLLGNKHLPDLYLLSSERQRRELLSGLVDSDGHVDKRRGRVRYHSRNKTLAEQVRVLVRSLGYNATLWVESDDREPHPVTDLNGDTVMVATAGETWCVSWTPHDGLGQGLFGRKQMPVEARREHVGIRSIVRVDPEPGLCIEVAREDGLYLAGTGLTPTHNSTSAEMAVLALGCRGKRNYGLYIAETQEQADDHVANVAAMLESEAVEIAYPELGKRLMGKHGSAKGWRRNRIRCSTGFTLDAMGLDSAARGVKLESQRPDFMVFDDIDGELDTEASTLKKIKTITRKLLPAGSQDCAVLMIQNLVHEDSIFARLSDGRADFLMDRIVSGPIPAIEGMEYEERDGRFEIVGGEPSWPEGMPMKSCQLLMNDIGLTAFLAECQHETQPPEGDIFTHISFERCTHAELPEFKRVTVWVDPAVTTTDRSDSMGIQCDALGRDGKFYRLYSWETRSTPLTAIEKALKTALRWGADTVGVETDQGGDTWEVVYHQACENLRKEGLLDGRAPKFKHAKASTGHGSKIARAERMLVDYERGKFVHLEGSHHTLEQALRRFPKVKPYDLVDACLTADSTVATEDGWVPITDVSRGDRVLTRQGFRRVEEAGRTKRDEIWEITTEAGHILRGTWDHPVWTEEFGWMPLALTEGLRVTVVPCPMTSIQSKSSMMVGFIGAIPTAPNGRIASTTTPPETVPAMLSRFTVRSGSTSTVPSPPDATSTIPTKTPSTTTPTTLSASAEKNIEQHMAGLGLTMKPCANTSMQSGLLLPNGMPATKAGRGTLSTGSESPPIDQSGHSPASSAASRSPQGEPGLSGSVLSGAATSVIIEKQSEKSELASCVEGTSLPFPASPRVSAPSRVVTVRTLNVSADVWNLEVEGEHEFFANGILVHNSYWSWADLSQSLTRRRVRTRSSARQTLGNTTINVR